MRKLSHTFVRLKRKTMTVANFKQTKKVGVSGSFINQMMGNNASTPEVGKGATLLHYTDRSVCEVIEVSEDGMKAKLEYLETIWDNTLSGGMGHQNWKHLPTGNFFEVVWRKNGWYSIGTEVSFTKQVRYEAAEAGFGFCIARYLESKSPELLRSVYDGDVWPRKVVEGITKSRVKYNKREILFGTMDYHYDWSF